MKRVKKIEEALGRLRDIDDPQVEYLLVRSCLGIPKLVFALRNSPPRQSDKQRGHLTR